MAEEDGVLPRQDPSAVALSTEAVASYAESRPVKSTSVDVFKRNTPGNQSRENGASESSGRGEAGARNQGTGPSPLHPQAYPGRLGKKLQDQKSGGSVNRPDKGAILPKFGDWVNDPASGEGYTVIFDKKRDEKKTGGAGRIPDPAAPINSGGDSQKLQGPAQECPGWLCCFYSSGTK